MEEKARTIHLTQYATIVLLLVALFLPAGTQSPEEAGRPLVMGYTYDVPSEAFGSVRLTVRTPSAYDADENADRAYPVLYLIDGGPEQDFPHVAGLAQLADANPAYGEFILIGVETEDRRARISPPVADPDDFAELFGAVPGGADDFRAFLRDEAIPWVDARYRTSGRDAVLGESLAGLFIVETFLREPDLFDDYVASSPSMWWEDMALGLAAPDLLAAHGPSDRTLTLYMADEGYWMEEGLLKLVRALEADAPPGLRWAFHDLGGSETHKTIFHTVAFDAIRSLYPQPDRIYRPGAWMTGVDPSPRTPEMEEALAEECDPASLEGITPADTRGDQTDVFYQCLLYDYGPVPTGGNWDGLSR